MIDLKDFEYDELIEYLTSVGEKKFRAEQIFSWLHKGVESYDEMTNLSKATREKLEKETYVSTLKIREKYVSKIDGTVKYLFELPDGNCIESVVYALSSRTYDLYIKSSRLQNGLSFLCVNDRRTLQKFNAG